MISKLIYIVFLIALVLGSVYLTRILMKKFKLNRWIIGTLAPLVLIVPSIFLENINPVIWNGLLLIFFVLSIMFFEITRYKLENNQIKGVVNYKKK